MTIYQSYAQSIIKNKYLIVLYTFVLISDS